MENAKKYFEEAIKTEEAKELFASVEKPATEEDAVKIHIEIAAKLGIELSAEEIVSYFAEKSPAGEVNDEELSQLSGGRKDNGCIDTYRQSENCWWDDACDYVTNDYDDYDCKWSYSGKCALLQKASREPGKSIG